MGRENLDNQAQQYDPRDIVGDAGYDIPEIITDTLHEAEVRFDKSGGELILTAVKRGIRPGDVLRDVFNSLATLPPQPEEVEQSQISAEALTDLSQRLDQTSSLPLNLPAPSPVGHPPILNPSAFSGPDLVLAPNEINLMPASSNQPDGTVVNKKRPLAPLDGMI